MTRYEAVEILEEVKMMDDSMFVYSQAYYDALDIAIEALKAQEPRMHGRWEEVDDGWNEWYYRCSACGCEWFLEDGTPAENGMNYCPRCGARNIEG